MLGNKALGLCVFVYHDLCVQLVKLLTACTKVVDTCTVSLFTLPPHPSPPPTHSVQQENHDTSQMQDSVSSSGHLVMVVEREKERKSEVPEPSLGTPEYSNKFYSTYVVEILLSHIILVLQCLKCNI